MKHRQDETISYRIGKAALFLCACVLAFCLAAHTGPARAEDDFDIIAEENGIYTLIRYNGLSPEVVVPEYVTAVAGGAFADTETLKINSVMLPESVNTVDADAFTGCADLKIHVTEPAGEAALAVSTAGYRYYTVGDTDFALRCSSITTGEGDQAVTTRIVTLAEYTGSAADVTVPEHVTAVAGGAFADTETLEITSVSLPESVNTVDEEAFTGCADLKIHVSEAAGIAAQAASTAGYSYYLGADTAFALRCSSTTTGEGSQAVTNWTVQLTKYTGGEGSFTIPAHVTSIGTNAFTDSYAREINVPDYVTSVGNGAFSGARYLAGVYVPTRTGPAALAVSSAGRYYYVGTYAAADTEYGLLCRKEQRTDPQTGETGDVYLFTLGKYNGSATTLTLSDDFIAIGAEACSRTSLTSVSLPATLTAIGNKAFEDCRSLTQVTFRQDGENEAPLETIGSSAFYYCSSLTTFGHTLSTVRTIGENAFFGCDSLTGSFSLSSLTSIGSCALFDCSGALQSAQYLTDDLTYVGKYAFPYNVELHVPTFDGNAAEALGAAGYSFTTQDGMTIQRVQDGDNVAYVLTAYTGTAAEVRIPGFVTEIGRSAFAENTAVTSVTIPNTVTSIDQWAFLECTALESVTIEEGSGLTEVGYGAFAECSSLTSINLPASVETIADSAFYSCTNLNSIGSPSLKTIGRYAFGSCSALESLTLTDSMEAIDESAFYGTTIKVYVPSANGRAAALVSESGHYFYLGTDTSFGLQNGENGALILAHYSGPAEAVIPTTVNAIGEYAFKSNTTVTSVSIPNTVTSIGGSAFYECSNLTSVYIPTSVTIIGDYAFDSCDALASLTLTDNVTTIGDYAFPDGSYSVLKIHVPSAGGSIAKLLSGAGYCYYVGTDTMYGLQCNEDGSVITLKQYTGTGTRAVVPDCVSVIDDDAFYKTTVTSVVLTDNITDIGSYSTGGIKWYVPAADGPAAQLIMNNGTSAVFYLADDKAGEFGLRYNSTDETIILQKYTGAAEQVSVPDTVSEIDRSAFGSPVKSVILTDNVTKIGSISSSIKLFVPTANGPAAQAVMNSSTSTYTVFYLAGDTAGEFGLRYNSTDETVILKKYSGTAAEVTIPDGVNTISRDAFSSSRTTMTSVTIPSTVTSMEARAFYGCTVLTDVTIREGLTGISDSAFYGCTALNSINIPATVTSIGSGPFNNCPNLAAVTLPDSVTSVHSSAFPTSNNRTLKVYVPTAAGPAAQAVSDANTYFWYYLPGDPEGAFGLRCGVDGETVTLSLKKYTGTAAQVTVPDYVSHLENEAFRDCTTVETVTIPSTVKTMGTYVFRNCTGLATVTIEEGLEQIGNYAFNSCSSLTGINIPASVTSIGSSAFYNCTSLASLTLTDSITSVSGAFSGASGLKIYVPTATGQAAQKVSQAGYSYYLPFDTAGEFGLRYSSGKIALYKYTGTAAAVTVPTEDLEGILNEINTSAFSNTAVTTLVLPDDTVEIYGSFSDMCLSFSCRSERISWCEKKGYAKVQNGEPSTGNRYLLIHTESVTEPGIPATCTEPGVAGRSSCADCGEVLADGETLPALGHDLGDPVYTWNSDYTSVTAVMTCRRSGCGYQETETAARASAEETQPATCTQAGKTTYTSAAFENSAFSVQTAIVNAPAASGHNLEKRDGQEPTEGEEGWEAYWECETCHLLFSDAEANHEISERVPIPALGYKHTLTIHYVYEDQTEAAADYTEEFREGTPYTVNSPDVPNYRPDTATVSGTMGTEDVTVTVTYTPNRCTITFDANGGYGNMPGTTASIGQKYKLPECRFTAPDDKQFDRWDKGAPGTEIEITGDTVIKALWKDLTWTITFDAGGGSGTMAPATVVRGQQYTLPNCSFTALPGKAFDRWDMGNPGDKIGVTGDMVITAQWKDKPADDPAPVTPSQPAETEKVTLSKLKSVKIKALSAKKIEVSWKKLSKKDQKKIQKIQIDYSTDKTFKTGVKTKWVKKTKASVKIGGLKKNTKYWVRIRAWKKDGNIIYVSKWITKSKKTKKK